MGRVRGGDAGRVDHSPFAARRAVRNLLGDLMRHPAWNVAQFDRALSELSKRRSLAVRQILLLHREGRVADEVAALEVLGRLARPEDDPALAAVANDLRAPESARVACALVLLGHDQPDLLTAGDVTALVLRWQARFISEEPALRYPLARLYQVAPRDERAGWIALQDDELHEPEARAAMFEMLLEVEREPALRLFLLEALARTTHPAARAGLRRVVPRGSEERDLITGALAVLAAEADPNHVPDGWTSRVGFCDGSGVFPLRFDFRRPGQRPRSALFLLSLDAGVRDALSLSGHEVGRYDRLAQDDPTEGPLLFEIPVPAAWAMLLEAERADLRDGRTAPRDHFAARRLLDPLADLAPRAAEPRVASETAAGALLARSDRLLDAPGYADWCYDAGEHLLDEFRLGLLTRSRPGAPPDDATVTRAAEALRRAGESRRLARLLAHNAVAHLAAGEAEAAAVALEVTAALAAGRFADVPLVRRLVRESLHPGHYFLAPPSDVPSRTTVMGMMLGRRRPTKARIFAVDLAWILLRAFEVWASRLPPRERPHDDRVQDAAFALAQAGTRVAMRWLGGREVRAEAGDDDGRDALLADVAAGYRALLRDLGWTPPVHDPDLTRLIEGLGRATLSLLFDVCLARCAARCPVQPRRLASAEEGRHPFPAGPEAEAFVRSWPGRFAATPSPEQASALTALFGDGAPVNRPAPLSDAAAAPAFLCPLCAEHRPASARSRAVLLPNAEGPPQPVCRRCLGIYRRDALFREQVVSRLGSLS